MLGNRWCSIWSVKTGRPSIAVLMKQRRDEGSFFFARETSCRPPNSVPQKQRRKKERKGKEREKTRHSEERMANFFEAEMAERGPMGKPGDESPLARHPKEKRGEYMAI